MSRLAPQPGERINRAKLISFTFDGKPVTAFEGDTIGSALYAAGQRDVQPLVQVPPPPRPDVRRRPVPELHLLGRRRSRRARRASSRPARGSSSSTSTRRRRSSTT